MNEKDRLGLKALVKTYYRIQDMRIRTSNQLRLRGDDTIQNEENMAAMFSDDDAFETIIDVRNSVCLSEATCLKQITKLVKRQQLWTDFLKGVKGCGPLMAAVIMTEFDINIATNVSKMWQFSGLNSGSVRGKKVVDYKAGMDVVRMVDGTTAKKKAVVLSDELIRGDRLKAGFVSPFNAYLRSKLIGVLAPCMIKSKSSYAFDFYYPYKERLAQEEGWAEESDGHRHAAAQRYMIKMFLIDLYKAWRTMENLPVRPPYQEEYLGHVHSA